MEIRIESEIAGLKLTQVIVITDNSDLVIRNIEEIVKDTIKNMEQRLLSEVFRMGIIAINDRDNKKK